MAKASSKLTSKKAKQFKKSLEQLDVKDRRKLHAVAVQYSVGKDKAPKIIATGKGNIAEKILTIAEEHKIPFFEDKTLSDLLSKLELETEIPPQLYKLVAEVLAFVYQLDKKAKRKKRRRK